MPLPARAEGVRSCDSTRRSYARSRNAGKQRARGSTAGSTGEKRMLARDAPTNTPQRLLETGEPVALKGARRVREGAIREGLRSGYHLERSRQVGTRSGTSLVAYFTPTRQGWLYLAVILDLYSRIVVGWSMSSRCDEEL